MDSKQMIELTSRVMRENEGKSHEEIAAAMDKALEEVGVKGRVSWSETRTSDRCASAVEARTCHYVDHGDGTRSETWCGSWQCQ